MTFVFLDFFYHWFCGKPRVHEGSSLSSRKWGQIVCKVKKQKKVTGYEYVVIAPNDDQKVTKQKRPILKSKYKSKKEFKVKVRAYKKVGGKTYRGAWSKKMVIKTR